MEILPVSAKSIKRARQIIKRGGLVIYPTETVYGLGVDITNLTAVKKVFAAKGRNFNKPLSVMIASLADLKKLVYLNKKQETIVSGLLPGPFTLILRKKRIVFNLLTSGSSKVGVRWSPDKFCQQLVWHLPVTATSANLSDHGNSLSIKKLAKDFAGQVDLILVGKKMGGQPSRVIDLTTKPFKILR
jgi:L-threonylcarbamoyladenylate synthase